MIIITKGFWWFKCTIKWTARVNYNTFFCGPDKVLGILVWFSYNTVAHQRFMLYKNINCQELRKPRWIVARAAPRDRRRQEDSHLRGMKKRVCCKNVGLETSSTISELSSTHRPTCNQWLSCSVLLAHSSYLTGKRIVITAQWRSVQLCSSS
jgi:hypothetical protein